MFWTGFAIGAVMGGCVIGLLAERRINYLRGIIDGMKAASKAISQELDKLREGL